MGKIFSTAFLMGGLGNQLFQIANSYSQSLEANVDCFFRTNSSTNLQGNNVSNYFDNIFRKIKFKDDLNNYETYYEPGFEYIFKKFNWKKSIEFYGYYQSSKNFLSYKKNIAELFEPDEISTNYLKNKYSEILNKKTCSIHIRLGDYKSFLSIHPIISYSYIKKSIDLISDYSSLFVFSDDKNWAKENINYPNTIFVDEKDYLELWLMSMCENNIISNSTFSWWGSFLNKNDMKKIIAPSIWFGPDGPKNYKDIYEESWTKLEVEYRDGELIC